jgi:putative nucleotidyltransferase with HDIG domain
MGIEALMIQFIQHNFNLPDRKSYEGRLQNRTLNMILWGVVFTSVILGLVHIYFNSIQAADLLFALAFLCLLGLQINERGHYVLISILTSIVVLAAAFYNAITGSGLQDPAVLAYPAIILVGSLLFGKRASPLLFLASALSLVAIATLQVTAHIPAPEGVNLGDLLAQLVLLAAGSYLVAATMGAIEHNLKRAARSEAQLKESYELTLEGWVKALEYRDRETEGHCRRVTSLSMQLADRLGLRSDEIAQIHNGALLHDIGKMAIPDSILFKPGPLDEAEWELMRKHPVYAKEMLESIPFLQSAISIPYCHHERWDGQGYPQGLKGEEIPLPSRIFTIVDHWEALSSDRPYRKAMPKEQVFVYIKENEGRVFDPHLAEIFLKMVVDSNMVQLQRISALQRGECVAEPTA